MAKSKKGIFENLTFVISKTEDPHISTIIHDNGGKVLRSLSSKIDYFIQGYNVEDDGRLVAARNKCVRVISPGYIKDCVEAGLLVDIHLQAIGTFVNSDATDTYIFPVYFKHTDILSCFRPVSEYCREHEEQPQSFGEYLETERHVPNANPDRHVIYLQPFRKITTPIKRGKKRPVSRYDNSTSANEFNNILSKLQHFLSLFLCMPVKCLPEFPVEMSKNDATLKTGTYNYKVAIVNSTKGWVRLDAMETIGCLEELRPKDGFCILGVTDMDIYEETDHDEPLLGRATGDQAGVLSTWVTPKAFNRLQPDSFNSASSVSYHNKSENSTASKKPKTNKENGRGQVEKDTPRSDAALGSDETCESIHTLSINANADESSGAKINSLRALFNTAAHETLHMFGLDHCAYYGCVMNSWSDPHLDPMTSPDKVSPLHLCPVDLRKLHSSLGFNIPNRYHDLAKLFLQNGLKNEAKWITNIICVIESMTSDN